MTGCSGVSCNMYCEHGFEIDENGCEICHCKTRREYTCIFIDSELLDGDRRFRTHVSHIYRDYQTFCGGGGDKYQNRIKNWPIRLPILSKCLELKQCRSFAGLGYTSLVQ